MPESPLAHSLTPAERVALARIIKAGEEAAAKIHLKEGTEEQVSFDVHVEGWVEYGRGTPEENWEAAPDVNLETAEFLLRVIRELKVRPSRFADAVAVVAQDATEAEDLVTPDAELDPMRVVLQDAGAKTETRLPKVPRTKKAKPGTVSAKVTGRRLGSDMKLAA